MWKRHGFFDQRNYIGKSRWKRCGFFNQQNYIEEVLVNDMESRGNLHNIKYNINVESTWIQCGVPIGLFLFLFCY